MADKNKSKKRKNESDSRSFTENRRISTSRNLIPKDEHTDDVLFAESVYESKRCDRKILREQDSVRYVVENEPDPDQSPDIDSLRLFTIPKRKKSKKGNFLRTGCPIATSNLY